MAEYNSDVLAGVNTLRYPLQASYRTLNTSTGASSGNSTLNRAGYDQVGGLSGTLAGYSTFNPNTSTGAPSELFPAVNKELVSSSPMDASSQSLYRSGYDTGMANANNKKSGFFDDIFSDENKMGNITGLASTLMQAASLPMMMKNAKLQNKALQFNLDTAKQEQNRRNTNIDSFNNPSAPTSLA